MSRLPTKVPQTFENFNFNLLKGKDLDSLKALPTLSHIYAHSNLAFIGPPGTGKTHLAQAFGYACCTHGVFSGPALERIKNSPIKELAVLNTIDMTEKVKCCDKIKVLPVAHTIAKAITTVHEDLSLSAIYED